MKIYVGQTRSRALIERLRAAGWGEMTVRGELPPRRTPWAFDNGAFRDWRLGRPFQADQYERDLKALEGAVVPPDFIVVPDLVAEGAKSLEFSLAWVPQLLGLAPLYLSVQDGMTPAMVDDATEGIAGIFIGGTVAWKVKTGEQWVRFAHDRQLGAHIGRAGSINRVKWARRIGADSIDSCIPLWEEENLVRFVDTLRAAQADLFHETPAWEPPAAFWKGFGVAR